MAIRNNLGLDPQSTLDLRDDETVGDAYERILREATSNSEQGRWFEHLFMTCVRELPEFEIEDIWPWRDWPDREAVTGRDGRDYGVDLVAELASGERVAIQCKCYRPGHKVSKDDVNSFIAEARLGWFDLRWIVSTSEWTTAAESAIRGQTPPVRRIDFLKFLDRTIKEFTTPAQREPKPLQEGAIDAVCEGLSNPNVDRGKLIMACGTGKTYVSLRIAERLVPDDGCIVFAAPSISLVSQARREWLTYTNRPMSSLVVCSDRTAGGRGQSYEAGPDELVCPVESDPFRIAEHLRQSDRVKVVFTTYHSLGNVVEAQGLSDVPPFDLAIADEAHRTTGVDSRADGKVNFQLFHDAENLIARKRLYMTATQRIYTPTSKSKLSERGIKVVDMGDVGVFGRPLCHVKFKDAVTEGELSDYRVIVLGIHESNLTPSLRQAAESPDAIKAKIDQSAAARLLGTMLAMNGFVEGNRSETPERLHRTIAYASNVARSKWFAETIRDPYVRRPISAKFGEGQSGLSLESVHLDANSSALTRDQELRRLNDAGKNNEARLISNVRIFTEGVDVPALDAVSFLDPRNSQIDIVQAVGRVMRRAEGKRFGYIIVPICIPEDVDNIADTLAKREDGYRAIGEVLRALQSHDERLADQIADYLIVAETNPDSRLQPPRDDVLREDAEEYGSPTFDLQPVATDDLFTHVVSASGLGKPGQMTAITIEGGVKRAAAYLMQDEEAIELLRDTLELAPDADAREVATVAALLLCNACITHKRLKSDAEGMAMLVGLDKVMRAKDPVEALIAPWDEILERDFEPIFRPALAVLQAVPRSVEAQNAILSIAECANDLADEVGDLGYDHAGPLYHRILGSAESDGAFYTKHISALMLAGLALSPDLIDWSDIDAVKRLRILDPACGTGTLLMAALRVIKDRALEAGAVGDDSLGTIHRELVQDSIRGLDINYQATQLAAANLTLGAPSVDFKAMQIYTMQHGPQPDGNVRLGSLELLVDAIKGEQPDLFANIKNAPLAHDEPGSSKPPPDVQDVDVVLMNPPFTNNEKRGQRYAAATVNRMREREGLIKQRVADLDSGAGSVIDSTSVETFFAPLAESLINDSNGVLGQIMPTTACTGAAAAEKRKFLADRFHIDTVVTTHDPKIINFSENTTIHESLLLCRRPIDGIADAPTRFVSLRKMPETPNEVDEWLSELHSGKLSDWHGTYEWPRDRVAAGDWSPAQYYDGELASIVLRVCDNPRLTPANELARVEPNPPSIRQTLVNPTNNVPPPPRFRRIQSFGLTRQTLAARCSRNQSLRRFRNPASLRLSKTPCGRGLATSSSPRVLTPRMFARPLYSHLSRSWAMRGLR